MASADSKVEGGAMIRVEVAFALPDHQEVMELDVRKGVTAQAAFELSGISDRFPGENLVDAAMGIFSRPLNGIDAPLPADYILEPGDRLEIYRPLLVDPKQARLERAARASKQRTRQGKGKSGKGSKTGQDSP